MLDIVFRNLSTRKVRTFLCMLAVLAGVFLIGVTVVMNNWMTKMMTAELARYMGKIYVQQGGSSYPPFDSSLSQDTAIKLLARTDLMLNQSASAPLIFIRTKRGMMPFMPADEMVIGIPVGQETILLGKAGAAQGVDHFPAGEQGNVALLGSTIAKQFDIVPGDEIQVNNVGVRVIGVLEESSMDSVNIAAIMPLEAVQRIFDKKDLVSSILITPNDVRQAGALAEQLRSEYPSLAVVTQEDMLAEAEEVMRQPLFYMSSMGVTGIVVAMIVIMSTMFMAVSERTREIGILRALGAQKRKIFGLVLGEALVLAMAGIPPAFALVYIMSAIMEASLPTPAQIAQIIGAALFAAIAGGCFPAWRAVHVEPLEALRYE